MRTPGGFVTTGLCFALLLGAVLLSACGNSQEACTPDCENRCGGDDGCGGVCARDCPADTYCESSSLTCRAACTSDADCAALGLQFSCDLGSGECVCGPACEGRCAGDDGCGGVCPDNCSGDLVCHTDREECWDGSCAADSDCPSADMCLNGVCGKP